MSSALRRLLAAIAILVAGVVLVIGFQVANVGEPDDAVVVSGDAVDALVPRPESEILRQEPVGVDLAVGYLAALAVNGIEIPDDQLQVNAPLGEYLFEVGEGKAIEDFIAGENCVTATYWRVSETRNDGRQVTWCFEVT